MGKISNLIEALVAFYASWNLYCYYTGRLKLSDGKEKRRQIILEKYGWLFVLIIIVIFIAGLNLLLLAF